MDIKSLWRRITTPILIAEWHWSGDNLADLPKAAWRDFRRAIRAPIIKMLACNDLIIVGDVYGSSKQPAVVQVPSVHTAEIIGSISVHDGPAAVVPRGCKPRPAGEGDDVGDEARYLVKELRDQADGLSPSIELFGLIHRAADLLEQRHPTPVPVSERLPGPEDCDAEGRCWLHLPDMGTEPLWRLTDPSMRSRYHSHWLPANALPLPQGEVE